MGSGFPGADDEEEDTGVTRVPDLPLAPLEPEDANRRLWGASLEQARREADGQRARADSLDSKNDELLASNIEKDQVIGELKGVTGRQSIEILRLKGELREALLAAKRLQERLDALRARAR